jgi:ERCC4-type nuclease
MPIWLDYRERGLHELAPSMPTIAPPVGDIWIGEMGDEPLVLRGGGVVLERKSLVDLEASVMDGRYEEQRGRMLAYGKEHKVAVAYVVEGETASFRGRRFTGESILKVVTQMQLRDRIPVFQTASMRETIALATIIEGEWAKAKGAFACADATGATATPVAASYTKSASRDTRESFLLGVLTQCRGVSEALARIVAARVESVEGLMRATEAELAAMAEGKRKVGKAVAARLYGLLHASAPVAPSAPSAPSVPLDVRGGALAERGRVVRRPLERLDVEAEE